MILEKGYIAWAIKKDTSPGYFELDGDFQVKRNYVAFKEYNATNKFCFRIRDRISGLIQMHKNDRVFQNISNQEKAELKI